MFAIDIDRREGLVSVKLAGLLSVEETENYVLAMRTRFVNEIGRRPYRMLIDISDCPLQTQAVVETFRRQIEGFPQAQRIAIVLGKSIAKMQMRRILDRDYARFFDTDTEARGWLAELPTARNAA